MAEKTSIEDVPSTATPASARRPIADAVGAENVSINYYELAPGESFAFGYHSHSNQEELFYVIRGTATFETEGGDVEVDAGELIRFAPGERQQGTNRGEEPVVALALGAPRDTGDSELFRECPECGERTPHRFGRDGDALLNICLECGAETGRYRPPE